MKFVLDMNLSPGWVGHLARQAIEAFRSHVDAGALLSIDEGRTRVRMLPLRRS